ncbi:ribonuclease P protein subunit p30 isoform X1 [Schistocerca americana]|uniref:ribonuclease P protein subunit p30 isoform X1 n=1 Tax=Schistocerca americana TaxID=7009 RepID=UPI001F4F2BD1|nr:ribonuclease P protein subunit p30 isoform X1 [Schistocerca americana]XP_049949319.1 ribonuclease P protein subunit p30 isoform X1 [Schistocerca serialis cubense]
MNNYKAFYDLNIAINEQEVTRLRDICDTLVTYGYKTVALNYEIEDLGSDTKKKKKKKGEIREVTDIVPEPLEISALVKEFGDKLTLVHRLTFPFSDQQQFHMLNQSKNLKKYKILAAVPKTQSAFQSACSNLDIDIISLDCESRTSIRINRKMYNLAVERGTFFEIMYAPAILDSTARRNTIYVAHMYHTFGKSKNVIISSGARESKYIRGPYDIVNLGLIFGLSEEQTKKAVSSTCRALLTHADGRRCGKIIACIQSDTSPGRSNEVSITNICDQEVNMDEEDLGPTQKKMKQ